MARARRSQTAGEKAAVRIEADDGEELYRQAQAALAHTPRPT